jgi:hypothetical protein
VGSVVAVVMLTPALTVMEKVPLAVFDAESVTFTVKLVVPVAVGLPLRTPAAERPRPAGNAEVAAQVWPVPEPPVAASAVEV